jgi:hypothetical protein
MKKEESVMQANASISAPATVPALFEGYSRALMLRTAAFLLRYHASRMRGLHLDSQAIASLEEAAYAVEQHRNDQDAAFFPSTVPVLFEGYAQALVLHVGAFLLEHHAIMMRGLHVDPKAVAYLEEAAQTVEQQMDDQDASFPDLLNHAVLEVLRSVASGGYQEFQGANHPFTSITTTGQRTGK